MLKIVPNDEFFSFILKKIILSLAESMIHNSAARSSKKILYTPVPLLVILIEGCMICQFTGKISQKSLKEVSGLKIEGCMDP